MCSSAKEIWRGDFAEQALFAFVEEVGVRGIEREHAEDLVVDDQRQYAVRPVTRGEKLLAPAQLVFRGADVVADGGLLAGQHFLHEAALVRDFAGERLAQMVRA